MSASPNSAEKVLRRLEWTVIRRLDGTLYGDYRTLFRGSGLDLADLREYQYHDDVRHIDWNVTARLQTPHVREFQEDREVAAWFLLDLSGSVNFGSEAIAIRTLSSEFVTVIARLLTRFGNRVGAVMYSDGTDAVIPARGGRRHVLHLLDRMLKINEHKPNAPAFSKGSGRETDLAELLARAQQVIKRRSVIFVVSDFISQPGWGKGLALLARRAPTLPEPLHAATLSWNQRSSRFLSTTLALQRSRGGLAANDTSLLLTLHWQAADRPLFGHSQLASGGRQTHDLDYEDWAPDRLVRAGATAGHDADGDLLNGRLLWRTPRFEATANLWQRYAGTASTRSTDWSVGSALVWADGHAGVSGPVADSFALIVPHPALAGRRVRVDPGADAAGGARSDAFGPPVLGNLTSYQARDISIEVDALPPSWDLGATRPRLLPSYRSGLLVAVGTAGRTSVAARLRTASGRPRAYASGVLRRLPAAEPAAATQSTHATGPAGPVAAEPGDPATPDLPWFSNRNGRLRIDGVPPGRWAVLDPDDPRPLRILEISTTQEGLLDLGDLTPANPKPEDP